jgi:hypothetical protein
LGLSRHGKKSFQTSVRGVQAFEGLPELFDKESLLQQGTPSLYTFFVMNF